MSSVKNSMKMNSPLPKDLADPIAAKGVDNIIPPDILSKAQGLAIFTVVKAGFLFSGRAGSGIVVARLDDGSWSAPSAIGTGGMGFGGQIGAEITDFVVVLNNRAAVKSFATGGNVTLGGNLSVAAGPIGRTAEAGASASAKSVAAIYSYSKSKGLFAGVSIEGSVIVERKDANEAFYRQKVTAAELLSGSITPPPQADILYRALNTKASNGHYSSIHRATSSAYGGSDTDVASAGIGRSASVGTGRYGGYSGGYNAPQAPQAGVARAATNAGSYGVNHDEKSQGYQDEQLPRYTPSAVSGVRKSVGGRVSTDNSGQPGTLNHNIANQTGPRVPPRIGAKPEVVTALYDFAGEQATDLSFKKGDIITVIKKTESRNDWWTGKCNGREGSFPANYTQ
ncbi:hypothetical protein BGZ80_000648 [Entomortierella chlamydospora]|uniref:SH3 domain-containing protein n=1 Tax=Entomortierella chlamydospora TaxID=101097 RepID=A0A9P6MS37_9FUNG|nr:hypothetical protein BGZ79_002498 [Entomortierella chlamydospora]KAG0011484.1 hypothetical protein BGZ80_000648 [Entomortierella chlamydospora]